MADRLRELQERERDGEAPEGYSRSYAEREGERPTSWNQFYGRNVPLGAQLTPEMFYEGMDGDADPRFLVDANEQYEGVGGASADPFAVSTQRAALEQLARDVNSARRGNWTQDITARRNDLMAAQQQQSAGYAGAQQQQLAARGQLGDGAAMALSQAQAQQQATQGNALDAQVQQSARMRALQDLARYNTMSSQQQAQDFGEEYERRAALDAYNRYNTDYRRGVRGRDADRQTQSSADRANAAQSEFNNRQRATQGNDQSHRGDLQREEERRAAHNDRYVRTWMLFPNAATNMLGGAGGGGG